MLGNLFRISTNHKQRANKKQKLKLTVLSQAEAKGSKLNMLCSIGLRLRQHCQSVMLAFFVKQFFEEELIKRK
jgi:hypothetical protein